MVTTIEAYAASDKLLTLAPIPCKNGNKLMADIANDPKEVGKWMKANGVSTQYAEKFLKALDKQVGKAAKKISVDELNAVKNSVIPKPVSGSSSTPPR